MNCLLIVFIAVIISVSGEDEHPKQEEDSEVAASHPEWSTTNYGIPEHSPHLASQVEVNNAELWKAKEFAEAKALADHHVALAASKAKAAAEEQARALAFQAATQAKAAADQEAEHALWKAKAAAEEETKALLAAQDAEFAAKAADQAAINAQNAAEELQKSLLAAQARAEEESRNAADKTKFAEEIKQKAALSSEARENANNAAALATQKVQSAEEALWKAKHEAAARSW